MIDAIEAACRGYLLERDIDPDYPHVLKPGAPAWWETEVPAIRAAITAYEAAKGGGVGVKPLEWRNVDASPQSDDWWLEAVTPFGPYTVAFVEEHKLPWLLEPFRSNLDSNYATEDAAKAAAQADYEARIRSALTSPASGAEYRPTILHLGVEAGDPYWQFVERDVPAVTGQVFAANVEMLTDYDGNLVGFNIFEPSPASGERDAVIEECAKVADGIAATHRSIGRMNLPAGGGPVIQEDRARVAEDCSVAIRALRMEGK